MKATHIGVRTVAILAIVLLSLALILEKSKNSTESHAPMVGSPTKSAHEALTNVIQSVTPTDTSDVSSGSIPEPTTMITGTTDVPLYPGARQIQQFKGYWDKPGAGAYNFTIETSAADGIAFYTRELEKRGWALLPGSTAYSNNFEFAWTNPVKEIPIRRYLSLSINGVGDKWQGFRAFVSLAFERWPHPDYVPLYPDAQQVQTEWVKDDVGVEERITSYETHASVAEIEAYYKDAMIQHGWQLGMPQPSMLYFSYRRGKDCTPVALIATPTDTGERRETGCSTGSSIEVRTNPGKSGYTKVELTVSGDELIP